MSNEKTVRREKPDVADAIDTDVDFLPGQIPVDQDPGSEATGEERQPNPVDAEKAVNPELIPVKDRKPA